MHRLDSYNMKRSILALVFGLALAAIPGAQAQSKKAAAEAGKAAVMDINTATVEQLQSLSGIGDAYSKAIVKGRPYKRKDELVDRKIIPQATYDKIKDAIVARQK